MTAPLVLALVVCMGVLSPPTASAGITTAGVTTATLRSVAFADASVGYAAGANGTILKSVNGGVTWTTSRTGGGFDFRGASAFGSSVWAVDLLGGLVRSLDGGDNWEVVSADIGGEFYDTTLHDVDFATATQGFAVGTASESPPMAFRSMDAGYTWPFSSVFSAGEYDPPPNMPPYPLAGLGEFYAVDFVSEGRGWAAGHDRYLQGSTQHNDGVVWDYDSSRGAIPWAKSVSFAGSGPLYGVSFGSSTWGIVVGSGGKAYYTTNGGTSWTSGVTGTATALRGVATGTFGEAWAVGDGGLILRTADGGANWTALTSPVAADLHGISAIGGSTAVAVGASGTIVRTTDGTTWAEVGVPPSVTSLACTPHASSSVWYPSRSPNFSWAGAGGATGYSYDFDQLPSTVPDETSEGAGAAAGYTGVADGVWYFHVRATNGSEWGEPSHLQIRVDGTVPTLSDDAQATYTGSATIHLTAADTGGSGMDEIRYTLDGGSEQIVAGSAADVSTSEVGPHTLLARAYDNAGNPSAQSTIDFEVTELPSVTSLACTPHASSSTWYPSRSPNFSWAGAGGATGYSYDFDQLPSTVPDETSEGAGAAAGYTGVADGVWYFHVRATNGSEWGEPSHLQIRVDGTVPTLSDDAQATYTGAATIHLTAADTGGSGMDEIRYTLDGGSEQIVAGSAADVSTSEVGPHTLLARAYDNAGNPSAQSTIDFEVTAPVADTFVPIEGSDRFGTAVAVSKKAFPAGADTVVIATAYNWPDALGGAALAAAHDGPILLVKPFETPRVVMNEITRLEASKIIILGGTSAVSSSVESALESKLGPGDQVSRIGGANRYETARMVASAVSKKMGGSFEGWAFVATGANFPDALAGSPISAAKGWPIYLVGSRLSSADVNSMKAAGVTDIVILGGTSVVPSNIESGLKTAFGGSSHVIRKAGPSRYATAVKVATFGVSKGLHWDQLALATGENFPDALAGGVLQGRDGSVMLLTPGAKLDSGVKSVLNANEEVIHEVRFLGGTSAVGSSVRNTVKAVLE